MSHTDTSRAPGTSQKFRTRFGPQYPYPTTAIPIINLLRSIERSVLPAFDRRILGAADDPRRHTRDHRVIGHISGDDRAGADHRAFADGDAGDDRRVAADRGAPLHPRRYDGPVRRRLQAAID